MCTFLFATFDCLVTEFPIPSESDTLQHKSEANGQPAVLSMSVERPAGHVCK